MENEILDKELLGFKLRQARVKAGYEKAEDFANALEQRVGYSVSRQTIYNIESGKQEPKLSLYLAMRRLLFPDERAASQDEMINDCLTPRWRMPLSVLETIQQDLDAQTGPSNSDLDSLAASYSDTINALTSATVTVLENNIDFSNALKTAQKPFASLTAPAAKMISQSVSQGFAPIFQSDMAATLASANGASGIKQTRADSHDDESAISGQSTDDASDSEGKATRS